MQRIVNRSQLHAPQEPADLAYWLAQPVQARIDALEALRLQHSQGQPVDFRVQRVCRVTPLKPVGDLQ